MGHYTLMASLPASARLHGYSPAKQSTYHTFCALSTRLRHGGGFLLVAAVDLAAGQHGTIIAIVHTTHIITAIQPPCCFVCAKPYVARSPQTVHAICSIAVNTHCYYCPLPLPIATFVNGYYLMLHIRTVSAAILFHQCYYHILMFVWIVTVTHYYFCIVFKNVH